MDERHEVVQSLGFPVLIETDISSSTPYPGPYCPQTYDCSNISGYVSFDIGRALSYVTITSDPAGSLACQTFHSAKGEEIAKNRLGTRLSSGLSCLGSILVIATFLLLKDMRTGAQKIVTLLASANLITAVGYILGSINFLVHFNETDTQSCNALCRTQASITSWSSLCSFCWTIILAFYFYMVIVYNRKALASRLVPLYNIIVWSCPLLVTVPLTVVGKLGYARCPASSWCFVKDEMVGGITVESEAIAFVFVAGKLWEIFTYIGVIIIYKHIIGHLSKHRHLYRLSPGTAAEQRLVCIPALFLLLRVWGTIQFFVFIGVSLYTKDPGCIPIGLHAGLMILGTLQALGDTGQGWGDAILYILFLREIRKRLFLNPLKQILQKCCSVGKHIGRVNQQRHNIDSERTPIMTQMTRTVTGCPSYTHFTVQHEESDVS